jgi:hypothetical protein
MAHLDTERNAAVRAFVEKRIAEHYESNRSAYAKASGLSPSIVSELLNGGRGAGLRVVDRIAAEAGVSPDVVTGRAAPATSDAHGVTNELPLGGTAWGNLDGWVESEEEVRRADKRWSDWQYERAKAIRGFQPPVPVTPAVVVQALMLVFATTPADELAKLEAERQDAELRRMQKAAETRAGKRK